MIFVFLLILYESRTFGRISYGFGRDEDGYVYAKDDEANIIRLIYKMCIQGLSLLQIQTILYNREFQSPSGKDKWNREAIDKTINNKKYVTSIISLENFWQQRIVNL